MRYFRIKFKYFKKIKKNMKIIVNLISLYENKQNLNLFIICLKNSNFFSHHI